jgi:hypothetical protein
LAASFISAHYRTKAAAIDEAAWDSGLSL